MPVPPPPGADPDVPPDVAATLDGGSMDCGSGLLLLLTRHLRGVSAGEVLLLRTEERSVLDDLPDWARLAGHRLDAVRAESDAGPWHVAIRRGRPRERPPAASSTPGAQSAGYSTGEAAPLGSRLWLYTNFDCNLACDYCCARSSPSAAKRRFPVELADQVLAEFAELGGREVLFTGGEPFLHPELDRLVEAAPTDLSVAILTNAMVIERGSRRRMLEALDPRRVVLQISLDSAEPGLHDTHRGRGSHVRSLQGLALVRDLGFRVKVAATLRDSSARATAALHDRLSDLGIAAADRLIRPVAAQGTATDGMVVTVDSLAPEPTLTVDGAWWHPVAVTDPGMRVAESPAPLAEVFATVADAVAVQDRAHAEGRRHVFRCT